MFKVVHKGGMIGSKREPRVFADKEAAKAYAKQQRSYLSRTDRQYYKESYKVQALTQRELAALQNGWPEIPILL